MRTLSSAPLVSWSEEIQCIISIISYFIALIYSCVVDHSLSSTLTHAYNTPTHCSLCGWVQVLWYCWPYHCWVHSSTTSQRLPSQPSSLLPYCPWSTSELCTEYSKSEVGRRAYLYCTQFMCVCWPMWGECIRMYIHMWVLRVSSIIEQTVFEEKEKLSRYFWTANNEWWSPLFYVCREVWLS